MQSHKTSGNLLHRENQDAGNQQMYVTKKPIKEERRGVVVVEFGKVCDSASYVEDSRGKPFRI